MGCDVSTGRALERGVGFYYRTRPNPRVSCRARPITAAHPPGDTWADTPPPPLPSPLSLPQNLGGAAYNVRVHAFNFNEL